MKVLHFYLPSSTLYSLPCSLYLAACGEAFSRNSRMEYQLSSKVPLMQCLVMPCVQIPSIYLSSLHIYTMHLFQLKSLVFIAG